MPRAKKRAPVVVPPGEGRTYAMGPVEAVFFVLEGTMSFFVGGAWVDAPKGSLVIAPGGTPHDFENRTATRAGALNFSVPGGFEPHMEGIAEWFRARSASDSRTGDRY